MAKKKVLKNEIPKLINKNIINIHLDKHGQKKLKKNKKESMRQRKHRNSNRPFPNNNVATNQPQQLNASTATQREREGIIGTAIENNQLKKNILLLEDGFKDHIPTNDIIKFTTPKKTPFRFRAPINDQNINYSDNNIYDNFDEIPPKSNPMYNNATIEELHPKQKDNESNSAFIKRDATNAKARQRYRDMRTQKSNMNTRSGDIFNPSNITNHNVDNKNNIHEPASLIDSLLKHHSNQKGSKPNDSIANGIRMTLRSDIAKEKHIDRMTPKKG
jgi:hypothetical protein